MGERKGKITATKKIASLILTGVFITTSIFVESNVARAEEEKQKEIAVTAEEKMNSLPISPQIQELTAAVPGETVVYQITQNENTSIETNEYSYRILNGNTVEITDYHGNGGDVVVPAEIGGKKVVKIGEGAFSDKRNITSITLPDGIAILDNAAFFFCSMRKINIPESVTTIGVGTFRSCDLENIELPNSVKSIGEQAFLQCPQLKKVLLPDNITYIPADAFMGCAKLEKIELPDCITSIGYDALSHCSSLTEIKLPEKLIPPDDRFEMYGMFVGCNSLNNIRISEKNPYFCTIDGVLYNKEKTEVISYPGGRETIELIDGVKSIGPKAFGYCQNLKSVDNLPNSITNIGSRAFEYCQNLVSVVLPEGVISIDAAFSDCYSLRNVQLPKSIQYIGSNAFERCKSLEEIEIPENVKELSGTPFRDCYNLKSIKIPRNVTIIGWDAFEGCKGFMIQCYKNSYAEDYAIEQGYSYEIIGVKSHSHVYDKQQIKKATLEKKGSIDTICSICGKVSKRIAIDRIRTVKISKTKYTYDGKEKKPSITILAGKNKKLSKDNYKVTYSDNKNVGKGKVTIKLKGNYAGTIVEEIYIYPQKTNILSVIGKAKGFTVQWKEISNQVTGYQIEYSTNTRFNKSKIITKKGKASTTTIKKLKANKKYYVRIRVYKTVKVNGKNTKWYSDWSKVKTVKTKTSIR